MGIFDALIREISGTFGLGTQAATFLRHVIAMMTSDRTGGLGGFLDRFRNAGMTDQVASWLVKGANAPLSADQLQRVVGKDPVEDIARKVGLAPGVAAAAAAFAIPKAIDVLTPGGTVPATLPGEVRAFLSPQPVHAAPTAARADEPQRRGGGFKWWWLALPLAALAGIYMLMRPGVDTTAPGTPVATAPATIGKTPASLTLDHRGDVVGVSGVVGSEETRTSILDAIRDVFGAGKVEGDVTVDPNADASPGWLARLREALAALGTPGTSLSLTGSEVSLGGDVPDSARDALLAKLAAIFGPGYTVAARTDAPATPTAGAPSVDPFAERYAQARERTLAALGALGPDFTTDELVTALNQSIIHFPTASAELSADNVSMLANAAEAIAGAPDGTVLEIGGHTDSTGDEGRNVVLSQARAEAVRKTLIEYGADPLTLVARGYGSSRPIASNDTEDGRFANRRISFTAL